MPKNSEGVKVLEKNVFLTSELIARSGESAQHEWAVVAIVKDKSLTFGTI